MKTSLLLVFACFAFGARVRKSKARTRPSNQQQSDALARARPGNQQQSDALDDLSSLTNSTDHKWLWKKKVWSWPQCARDIADRFAEDHFHDHWLDVKGFTGVEARTKYCLGGSKIPTCDPRKIVKDFFGYDCKGGGKGNRWMLEHEKYCSYSVIRDDLADSGWQYAHHDCLFAWTEDRQGQIEMSHDACRALCWDIKIPDLNFTSWDATDGLRAEQALLQEKRNTAVTLSGGGSRAYVAGIGMLRGLTDLGLMDSVRYLGGISGGSWAAAAYTYYQPNNLGKRGQGGDGFTLVAQYIPFWRSKLDPYLTYEDDKDMIGWSREYIPVVPPSNDEELLGKYITPDRATVDQLGHLDGAGAALLNVRAQLINFMFVINNALSPLRSHDYQAGENYWDRFVSDTYLQPLGIPATSTFAWSAKHAADIIKRNPTIRHEEVLLPAHENGPFLVVTATTVAPQDSALLYKDERQWRNVDYTPMGSGRLTDSITLTSAKKESGWFSSSTHLDQVTLKGGMTESFAYGRLGANDEPRGEVPLMSLRHATAASSWILGGALNEYLNVGDLGIPEWLLKPIRGLAQNVLDTSQVVLRRWTGLKQRKETPEPDEIVKVQQGDGALVDNLQLLPMLQRKVTCVTLLVSPSNALADSSVWDPQRRLPRCNKGVCDIDASLASYFGVVPEGSDKFMSLEPNQVFSTEDFIPFVEKLQDAMAKGTGIVVQEDLETQANTWWGIEAHQSVKLTVLYLSRPAKWWNMLPQGTQDFLSQGKCKEFPHCPTLASTVTWMCATTAHALHSVVAWTVHENKETFKSAMSCPSPGVPDASA